MPPRGTPTRHRCRSSRFKLLLLKEAVFKKSRPKQMFLAQSLLKLQSYFEEQSVVSSYTAAKFLYDGGRHALRLEGPCLELDELEVMVNLSCAFPVNLAAAHYQQRIQGCFAEAVLSAAEQGAGPRAWFRTKALVAELRLFKPHIVHLHYEVRLSNRLDLGSPN